MLGCMYLLIFLCCGVLIIHWLLPTHRLLNRVWLGLSFGLLLMMWLPALWAFAFRFSITAHWLALATLGLLTGGAWLARDRRSARPWDDAEHHRLMQILAVCVPLTIFSAYLQYTHVMRVDAGGNWNVGQSTYGDLPMHLAFITGLVDSPFPPEYPFAPGVQLCYPFLTDTLSTSLYMMGCSLQLATILPATLMMALCYMGVMLLAGEMTRGKKTVVLATLLFFLNGGLGFLYDFDLAGGTEADGTLTVWSRIEAILTGYYTTPTNQPDPNNLRWSNIIADMMIPQRTFLGGLCMVLPCFYLLYMAFDPEKRSQFTNSLPGKRSGLTRMVMLLGVWGGSLPLIHTHSFLALGLASAGFLLWDMVHDRERLTLFRRYMVYLVIVLVLALPQLFGFTFKQALNGDSSTSFLRLQFNWVNNRGNNGLRDMYFWFYIKNIGVPFIGLILALFEKDRHSRRLFAGAFAIILVAELVLFQPNEYDNNKLFYLSWMLCCMIVSDYAAVVWRKMKGLRARSFIGVAAAVVIFLSAGLTLWREAVSSYQAFSAGSVEVAEFVKENTDQDAVFMCGTQHLNPISSIAGRKTVCGPDLWLYYHGIDTTERKADIAAFYADPAGNLEILAKYDVDYIYVSSYEYSSYGDIDTDTLDNLFERIYEDGSQIVWKVPEG